MLMILGQSFDSRSDPWKQDREMQKDEWKDARSTLGFSMHRPVCVGLFVVRITKHAKSSRCATFAAVFHDSQNGASVVCTAM